MINIYFLHEPLIENCIWHKYSFLGKYTYIVHKIRLLKFLILDIIVELFLHKS